MELTTTNSAAFSLRALPGDPDSPKCKFTIEKVEGNKEVRPLIVWHLAMKKIFTGLSVTTHAPAVPIVEATLNGTALIMFTTSLENLLNIRMEEVRQPLPMRVRPPPSAMLVHTMLRTTSGK